jgi:hypothetical protein
MKKLILSLVVAVSLAACQSSANPAHGEKGHTCSTECKVDKAPAGNQSSNDMGAPAKDHLCTAECKEGSHIYAHDEKGHVCDTSCMQGKKM